MGRIRYYHVAESKLDGLPSRLRDWDLHALTPEQAEERYGVVVKIREEDENARLPTFINWLPAFPGCLGRAYGNLVFRFPEDTWITNDDYRQAARKMVRDHRLIYAALWVVIRQQHP